jgi:hypothetical protein
VEGLVIAITYLIFKDDTARLPQRYTDRSIALLITYSAKKAATGTEQKFGWAACHRLLKASNDVRGRLISPIYILLAFSLALFVGMSVAMIAPSGDVSSGIKRSTDIELCPLNCEMYKISLDNASYNETKNSTNFAYNVSVAKGACTIESLFIDLSRCLNPKEILSAGQAPWDAAETMDSGVHIKFDTNIEPLSIADPAKSMIYSFELAGNWSEKLSLINADFVTTDGICSKDMKGPDCQKRILQRIQGE